MSLIKCTEISKTYRFGFLQNKSKPALEGLSLTVRQGEVFGIIGPNGAGKSTTIKILMGFVRADSGQATIEDIVVADPASHAHVGYLPEHPSLYKNLSITDHLLFAARLRRWPRQRIRQRIEEVLTLVNLTASARIPIRRFSKGMTQRAALAYALFEEPDILILDEPMSGLDPLGRQMVVDIIRNYHAQGHTILFCSHILSDVERICSRIAIMHQGRLAALTTPDELHATPSLEETNLTPLEALFHETVNPKESTP